MHKQAWGAVGLSLALRTQAIARAMVALSPNPSDAAASAIVSCDPRNHTLLRTTCWVATRKRYAELRVMATTAG